MVGIIVITAEEKVLTSTPEAFLSNASYATHDASILRDEKAFEKALEDSRIKTTASPHPHLLVGHPSHWPRSVVKSQQQFFSNATNSPTTVMVDSALLAAYGTARSVALVIELHSGGYSVGPVMEYDCKPFMPVSGSDLFAVVDQALQSTDLERRPLLMDNVVVTGLLWSMEREKDIIHRLQARYGTVSAFPSDTQIRTVVARHIPEYHVELHKINPSAQQVCSLFGAAISCRALLEMHK